MASRNNKPRISPAGRALWPKLTEPDTKFKTEGEYSVKLLLTEAEGAELLALCEETREAAVQIGVDRQREKAPKMTEATARSKVKLSDHPVKPHEDPETGEETGLYVVTFKMKASGVSKKTGKPWSRRPALFDAQRQSINPEGIQIWNGSVIKVAYNPQPWCNPKLECGCKLALEAVQVIELVNGGSRDYGFGEGDGYSYSPEDDPNPAFGGFEGAGEDGAIGGDPAEGDF